MPKGKTFSPGELPEPLVYVITPGFIRAMGIRISWPRLHLGGRPEERERRPDQCLRRSLYWPGEDAVGKILVRRNKKIAWLV